MLDILQCVQRVEMISSTSGRIPAFVLVSTGTVYILSGAAFLGSAYIAHQPCGMLQSYALVNASTNVQWS
jgi:hypothetical protein